MKLSQLLFFGFFLAGLSVQAQFNPADLFVDDLLHHNGNRQRSAQGTPGVDYWQNEADYKIEAQFDVEQMKLNAKVQITYTNNSPDDLAFLWLELIQNAASESGMRKRMRQAADETDIVDGFQIERVEFLEKGKTSPVNYEILGTTMQIKLPKKLKSGEKITFEIAYDYILQPKGPDFRSGFMDVAGGRIYQFGYWYPRMMVYDDYYGWNTLPFTGGGEMYLDYGKIEYKLTVPSDQLVVGAGQLMNEEKILTDKILGRLKKARQSNRTFIIRAADEIDQPVTRSKSKMTTWEFEMENTRDVAWAMSSSYIWDGAKINLSDGKTAFAQSVYPVESTQDESAWARSTEMIKASVEFFSDYVFDFPYPVASSVAGTVGGMEYPGFAFNYWNVKPYVMFLLASHEIGHTWFPMVVGSDERRNAFMDEGMNTFIDILVQEEFNNGEFAPKRDGEYAPGGGNPNDEIIEVMSAAGPDRTLMTPSDDMDYEHVHPLAYFKMAHGLVLLRDVILGKERFDYAFKHYANEWMYKHPRPEDFFRSMNNATGQDLNWFWKGWFYNNWQLDQGIEQVSYIKEDPKNGAILHIKNYDKMAMPVLVQATEENGKVHSFSLPVEIWKFGDTAEVKIESTSALKKVILDADHQMPDTNRANNIWEQ